MKRSYLLVISVFSLLFILAGCNSNEASDNTTVSNVDYAKNVEENPIVTITMEDGQKILLELYPKIAPNTVANFISLVQDHFYDGLIFHRVIPDFMIQGGDPDGNGTGGPGYSIDGEFTSNGFENTLLHERGVISMARSSDPNSAGSQFFIMVADATHLDGEYAAFGKVTKGLEVVDEIVAVEHDGADKPLEDQTIKSIEVDTFGFEYPSPVKK